jgi:hypothetical protein
MIFIEGGKYAKNQEKIRRRLYRRTARKGNAPYRSLSARRAYSDARDANRAIRSCGA